MIARPADVMASAQHRPPVWAAGAAVFQPWSTPAAAIGRASVS